MKFIKVYIYIYIYIKRLENETLVTPPFVISFKPLFFRDEGLFFDHSSFDQTTPSVVFFPRSGFSFPIKWFIPQRSGFVFVFPYVFSFRHLFVRKER